MDYTAGATPIQDLAGDDAANLTGQAVTNTTVPPTPPMLTTATVDGASLVLTYDEALDTGSTPATGDFVVTETGAGAVPTDGEWVMVNTLDVTLTLNPGVAPGTTVTVDYTAGATPIQDLAGDDAANLTGQAVTNTTSSTSPVIRLRVAGRWSFVDSEADRVCRPAGH